MVGAIGIEPMTSPVRRASSGTIRKGAVKSAHLDPEKFEDHYEQALIYLPPEGVDQSLFFRKAFRTRVAD